MLFDLYRAKVSESTITRQETIYRQFYLNQQNPKSNIIPRKTHNFEHSKIDASKANKSKNNKVLVIFVLIYII